jgi:hypothetical protein
MGGQPVLQQRHQVLVDVVTGEHLVFESFYLGRQRLMLFDVLVKRRIPVEPQKLFFVTKMAEHVVTQCADHVKNGRQCVTILSPGGQAINLIDQSLVLAVNFLKAEINVADQGCCRWR